MIAASNFVNPMHNGTATPATTTLGNVENITINNNNNDNNNSPIINSDQRIDFSHENLALNNNNNNNNSSNDNKLTNQNHLHNNSNNNNNSDEQNIKFDNSADKTAAAGQPENEKEEEDDDDESVDITISNVVTNFSVGCHLNLRQIAYTGSNVIYKREQSIVLMKLRNPSVTASIWSSGKITCTGATTEESAKCGSRKVARCLQKLGFRTKFKNYRIVNVLGSCRLPFGIKIHEFSAHHRANASYEPELHPGATYRIKELKAVQKIFQTGSITITAPSIRNVQLSVEHIYPLVHEFRKPKPPQSINNKKSDTINLKNNNNHTYNHAFGHDETNNKEDDEDGVDVMMADEELLINNNIDRADSDSD